MKKNTILALILLVLGLATRFAFYNFPSQVVFDEVYFGKYASDYTSGEYYFDPHPPLGKLLLHGMGSIGGVADDTTDYSNIGTPYNPHISFWYRLLPALTGALLPLVIFLVLSALGFSSTAAFTGGVLIIFENSLIAQSRFASLDGILLLSGFLSLWLYLIYKKSSGLLRSNCYLLSAIFASAAFSIKWTGLAYVLLIVIMEIIDQFDHKKIWQSFRKLFSFLKLYIGIGFLMYLAIFAIHFHYLPKSGQGNAFMTDRFQKTLQGNQYTDNASLKPKAFFGKFFELNIEMLDVNRHMDATHQYSSKWYTWPFMFRSVFYWQGTHDATGNNYMYFLGNPLIYWLGTLSILYLLYLTFTERRKDTTLWFILVGYLANFIPYIFIGRVMFLYHYQAALVFSILAIMYVIDRVIPVEKRRLSLYVLIILVVGLFLFFSPITYGLHLSDAALQYRMWLPSWR